MMPTRRIRRSSSLMVFAAFILSSLILGGCGSKKGETQFGEIPSNLQVTNIDDIVSRPQEYQDQDVAIEGKIVQECPTGCWFNLQDATGVIYVDINPSGFAIPQYTGKEVRVEGKVVLRGPKAMIVGQGVRLK